MKYDLLTFHSVRVLKADKSNLYEKENITHRVNISSYSLHYSSSPTKVTTDFAGTTISLVFIAVPFPKLDVSEVV